MNDEGETYDLERIKLEEMHSKMNANNNNSCNTNSNNRYKKIYKSFKSSIRRNSTSSSSSSTSINNGYPNKLATINSNKTNANGYMGDGGLNVFQNGYGYDDDNDNYNNNDGFLKKNGDYFYDHSVYPYAKTTTTTPTTTSSSSNTLSKTSKKVNKF